MGKSAKALKAFIDEIPDSALEALPTTGGTIYTNLNFRLDMQGVSQNYFLFQGPALFDLVLIVSYR